MFLNETLKNLTQQTLSFLPESASSSPYLTALVILLASFFIAKIVQFVFKKIFLRLTAHTKTELDDKIIQNLKSPIFYTIIIIGTYLSLHTLNLGGFFYYTDNSLQTVIIIIAAAAISRVANTFADEVLVKVASKTKTTFDDELLPLIKTVFRILVIFFAIMGILSAWDINVTPLLASAGILGFAVAFAAQSTIANLFGGIAVYFDKPFKIGDRIQLESGEVGDVFEVGIRSTRIHTLDGTLLILPNEKIANAKIINFNQPHPKMIVKIDVGVAYGSDTGNVKKALLLAAKNSAAVLHDPAPSVFFTEHGDFALKFRLIAWIPEPSKKLIAIDQLNENIAKELKKAKIGIPFPTQTVYLAK